MAVVGVILVGSLTIGINACINIVSTSDIIVKKIYVGVAIDITLFFS